MAAVIYFPLFLVLVAGRKHAIYYLPADLQNPEMLKLGSRCRSRRVELAGVASCTT